MYMKLTIGLVMHTLYVRNLKYINLPESANLQLKSDGKEHLNIYVCHRMQDDHTLDIFLIPFRRHSEEIWHFRL